MKIVFLLAAFVFGNTISLSQNVGIGTATPVSKLTIQTDINTTGWTHVGGNDSIIVNEAIGGISASLGTMTNHPFRIKANGSGHLHVYPAGQVIVGSNSTPAYSRFTVETTPGNYGITHSDNNIVLSTFVGGTQQFAYIGTQSNHPLSFYTNNSQSQMILMTNGNVGIGTNSPSARLDVAGNAIVDGNIYASGDVAAGDGNFFGNVGVGTFSNAGTGINILNDAEAIRISGLQPYITFFTGGDYKGYLWKKGADDMELGTAAVNPNGNLYLSIKGTPYLSIFNNGQVAIKGTPSGFGSPSFTINGADFNAGGLALRNPQNADWRISMNSFSASNLFFWSGNITVASVDFSSGDWISYSDRSVKENITPYKSVLAGIRKLEVDTYNYIHDLRKKRSFGLIAQNVAEYFPEIVADLMDKDGKKLLGISYAKTGVLAIKAIQEQQEIIESLEKRIATLEKLLSEKK